MCQTQCSGSWELRMIETGPHVLEPHTQGHSGQDESPGVEVNVTGSQAGQSHGDKGLIRVQTEALFQSWRPGRTSQSGGAGPAGPWDPSAASVQTPERPLSAASLGKPSWPPRQFYLLLPWTLTKHLLSTHSSQPTDQVLTLGTHCPHPILPTTLLGGR